MIEVSENYEDISLSYIYIVAIATELIERPKNYDVLVSENMFGDILSHLTSQLIGSIGLLPSASFGEINLKTNKRYALYEPIHWSAPDIAGKNVANPIGMIMSAAMMLEYSFGMKEEAEIIDNIIKKLLSKYRTKDILEDGYIEIGTKFFSEFLQI